MNVESFVIHERLAVEKEIEGKVLELLLILCVHYLAAADGASMSVVT